jgi:glycerol-3-phosphate dehydrogenase (NAD(P)+)
VQLARHHRVEMPISEQVFRVLHEGLSPQAAVQNLLARDIRSE